MKLIVVKQRLLPCSPWTAGQGHLLLLQGQGTSETEPCTYDKVVTTMCLLLLRSINRATKGVRCGWKGQHEKPVTWDKCLWFTLSAFLLSFFFVRPGLTYSLGWLQLPLPFCTRLIRVFPKTGYIPKFQLVTRHHFTLGFHEIQ